MDIMILLSGLMIPFLGTSAGAAMVFLMKGKINPKIEKLLLGFASGVMVAASVWSLLIPSIAMSKDLPIEFIPAAAGFLFGIAFLLILDTVIPHLHIESGSKEGIEVSKLRKTTMMVFAVTLHNIPEGMAVGVALAAALQSGGEITAASAAALSIGIAIQNFPEGAIISMPLKTEGMSKPKAFLLGVVSGAVEPVFGFITVLLTGLILSAMPYLLSFAAGAMLYVVVEELIPEMSSGEHSNLGTIAFAVGFTLMMVLDIALG